MPICACDDEGQLLQQCRRGSREAFEPVVKRYTKDAYRIALGLVGSRDDAMELSQEAFYRAFVNIRHLKPHAKFFPWFYQILRNLCFSHLRKRRLRRTSGLPQFDGEELTAAGGDWFDPHMVVERTENKDRVWQSIARLSPKHREVIILRHFRDMSYEQMAEALFCNKGTVMSRLYHARKMLKEILENSKGGHAYDL
ncbi:MAG: RNA polymerase sigma factor [Phycisphaerae bacterium]|nr:RNA polymerase sigma factor [Phycisphaerae bacterium]